MAVLLLYYLGFSSIRNYILKQRQIAVARFLALHDVLPGKSENLENNLRFLKDNTNVIGLDDFFSGRLCYDKINTIITFDDGYIGWMDNALPVLKKLNLPATFFISSGFVGLRKDDEQTYAKNNLFVKLPPREISGGLTSTNVRTLVDEGFTIGGHTVNHQSLDAINNINVLKYEISEDKQRLEEMTGTKINYFAYPTGAHINKKINIIDELQNSGYKGALTVTPGFNTSFTNRYLLHRDIINLKMALPIIKARIMGNIDAIRMYKTLKMSIKG
jgi:peptidoglycan/xylan/chitin deacetylase (PgdA/CDA1 family)